tara:strand:- start:434 stop:1585 length:1152 start_codon:yes stop_codon:yes gene_type:complete
MKLAYHPTTIKLHYNHCPYAVRLWKIGMPYDRSVFHTGVIAHAILEEIGKNPQEEPRVLADKVVEEYCSKGRSYDGNPEPPAPFTDAIEGAQLALNWHARYPVPNGPDIYHEHPFAFDQEWNEVDYYSPKARFRTLLDVVEIKDEYNEEKHRPYRTAIIRDYKTSWAATADELDSFQRKCQALVVWLKYEPDIIILEISNLRLRCNFQREIIVRNYTETLNHWKKEITLAIKTLDNNLNPNPGIGCIGCPYSPKCEHFNSMYSSENVMKRYIAAKEIIAKLEPQIRKAAKDKPPQTMSLGSIGYAKKERKKVLPSAQATLLTEWKNQEGTIDQLFQQLDLGVRTVEKIARILTNNKQDREDLIRRLTRMEQYSSFGIHKDKRK